MYIDDFNLLIIRGSRRGRITGVNLYIVLLSYVPAFRDAFEPSMQPMKGYTTSQGTLGCEIVVK